MDVKIWWCLGLNAESTRPCPGGDTEYRCSSGECIAKDEVCDGYDDCDNGEDEYFCDTYKPINPGVPSVPSHPLLTDHMISVLILPCPFEIASEFWWSHLDMNLASSPFTLYYLPNASPLSICTLIKLYWSQFKHAYQICIHRTCDYHHNFPPSTKPCSKCYDSPVSFLLLFRWLPVWQWAVCACHCKMQRTQWLYRRLRWDQLLSQWV